MESTTDAIAATHAGDKPIPTFPQGIALLSEPNLKPGFVLLLKIRDKNNEVIGFGSEQEVVSPESNFMQGRMIMDTTWTLTIPGRGSIFLYEIENGGEFVKKAVIPAMLLGKDVEDPFTFITSDGPLPNGHGVIVGGSGEFEGITGSFVEVTHFRKFTKEKMLHASIELQLAYKI